MSGGAVPSILDTTDLMKRIVLLLGVLGIAHATTSLPTQAASEVSLVRDAAPAPAVRHGLARLKSALERKGVAL